MSEEDRIGSVINMDESSVKTIHARITYGKEPLKVNIRDEEKQIAEKAAKLIARDYGEVIKKLEDE